ncbi:hypothetical protein [Kitasatospora cheerisanensis]|uniref:Uncharacterized protein n=1 Tax=Kitasatospora cheerisanensis KCTC 2395 TaxID=1348663 RepID=A0A066ZD14_9ACTN|nr:hypothetical protein [Kitasatospora cheerisanensis]KDN88191.1 hypothetical protein KCH_00410 [Kitasatospora cheerisanensis KCTC 2395]
MADVEGTELGSGHIRQIVESVYVPGTAGLHGGEVFRPGQGKPLTLSPCRLEQPRSGVRVDDRTRVGPATVPVPTAIYELRIPAESDGMWASVYVLAPGTDTTKLLTDLLAAGQACGSRTVTAADPSSRASAQVVSTAWTTMGADGPGVAVISASTPDTAGATAPPKGPKWTISPDGRLAPDGDLTAPRTPAPGSLDYGEAVLYGTNGRILVELAKVGGDSAGSAPDLPAVEQAYPAAQRALKELLAGFNGLPD